MNKKIFQNVGFIFNQLSSMYPQKIIKITLNTIYFYFHRRYCLASAFFNAKITALSYLET
jgi:hypothetical protein